MQTLSPLLQVNYVALSPMDSTYDDLDPVVDMVISSLGLLEPDLFTPVVGLLEPDLFTPDPRYGVLPKCVSSFQQRPLGSHD
jgi:hypothetical protein